MIHHCGAPLISGTMAAIIPASLSGVRSGVRLHKVVEGLDKKQGEIAGEK
jgi:hypothetical protein